MTQQASDADVLTSSPRGEVSNRPRVQAVPRSTGRPPTRPLQLPSDARALTLDSLEDADSDFAPEPSAPGPAPDFLPFPEDASHVALPPLEDGPADPFAEFERQELRDESTRVEERDALEPSDASIEAGEERPKLYVEFGPDAGREFSLHEGETCVGRGVDNDVILTDGSVSRKHITLTYSDQGVILMDLGSGNGTRVNGTRVASAGLQNHDRIELGATTFRFSIPASLVALPAQPTRVAEITLDQDNPSLLGVAPLTSLESGRLPSPLSEITPVRGTVVVSRGTLALGATALVVLAASIGACAMALLAYLNHDVPVAMPLPPMRAETTVPTAAPTPPVAPTAAPATPAIVVTPTPVVASVIVEAPIAMPVVAPTTEEVPVEAAPVAALPRSQRRHGAVAAPASNNTAILAPYRARNFAQASQLARQNALRAQGPERARLEELARNIDTFARRFPTAQQGDLGAMEECVRLDRRIGVTFAPQFEPRLVSAYVARARRTMSTQPAAACSDLRSALALRPNEEARTMSRNCSPAARTAARTTRPSPRTTNMAPVPVTMSTLPTRLPTRTRIDEDE